MAETPDPGSEGGTIPAKGPGRKGRVRLRWQSSFQHSSDPIFVLSRRRRLLYVNPAWESLTGLSSIQVRGLLCSLRSAATGDFESIVARTVAPPAEVLAGSYAKVHRYVAGLASPYKSWDIEFLPINGGAGDDLAVPEITQTASGPFSAFFGRSRSEGASVLCILGKITVTRADFPAPGPLLPDKLIALRDRVAQRYRLDQLNSDVPAMQRLVQQVRLACKTDASVAIIGEGGSGKHWIARTIHHQGQTRHRVFVALDCGQLPEPALRTLLEEEGGVARTADVGTLYLREPARLPPEVQARLADWVMESRTKSFRLAAGFQQDPDEEVRSGRLLASLHAALTPLVLHVLPLRERQADLPRLIEFFLDRASDQDVAVVRRVGPEAMEVLRSYSWPGNLRELNAVVTRANRHANGDRIESADLPGYVRTAVRMDQTPGKDADPALPLDPLLEQVERRLLLLALRTAKGNKTRAAEMLAIWRPRLLRRMESLGLAEKPGPEESAS